MRETNAFESLNKQITNLLYSLLRKDGVYGRRQDFTQKFDFDFLLCAGSSGGIFLDYCYVDGENLLPLFLLALFIPYLFYLRRVQGALYPQEEQEEAGRKAISKRGKEGLVFIGLVSLSMLIVFLSLINMDVAFLGLILVKVLSFIGGGISLYRCSQRYLERSSMTKSLLALFFFVFLAHSYEILLWMSFKASVILLELGF